MVMLAKPIIPQTRIKFTGETQPRILPSIGATVAIPLTHDWGPMGSELGSLPSLGDLPPGLLVSFADWTNLYGDSDTEGRTAVAGAFSGQNLDGAGGAGGVIPFRMGAGAVRASATIQNTAPANAIGIEAKWAGTRGNSYSFKIDVDPADATRDRLRVLYKGAVVETYSYPNTDIASLAASIASRDAGNIRLKASVATVTGTRLTATAGTSLVGGTDGGAITGADHTAAMAALEFQPFTIISPANLTDPVIQASYFAWIQTQDDQNRPVRLVTGGSAGEVLDTAITRTAALADPHVVNFGIGTWHDDVLNKDLSTAQLAPKIAGILAAKGEGRALTGAEIGGLHAVGSTAPTLDQITVAVQRGVTVLMRTDSDTADVRIAKGLTTFTSDTDAARPRRIFEEPRFITIMDLFVRRMRRWGDKNALGLPVNDDLRDAVRAYGSTLIDALLADGLILTKAQGAVEDPFIRTPVTTDDTVPFEFGWQFAYTANYLLGDGRVK